MFFDEKFKLEFDPLAYLFENEIDELFRIDSFKKQYNCKYEQKRKLLG